MYQPLRKNKGLSMIEILVTLAIILLIASVAVFSLLAYENSVSLTKKVSEIKALLEEARSLSLAGHNGNCYGVKILSGSSLVLFSAGQDCLSNYSVGGLENKILSLEGIVIDNLALPANSSTEIVFKKNTGDIYGTVGSFRLHLEGNLNKVITFSINQSGMISQQ